MKIKKYIGQSRFKSLLSSLNIKVKWPLSLPLFSGVLAAQLIEELEKDWKNLDLTIAKYENILEVFKGLPTKPVIIIGTVQRKTRPL